MAPKIQVIDMRNRTVQDVEATVGMVTRKGTIVRVSKSSIWTKDGDGREQMHSARDAEFPSVFKP